jgi:glycerol-3-phosphate acyltransferase PlsY
MEVLIIFLCWILGSLNGSLFTIRLMKWNNIIHQGSGNPGATNMLRLYGVKAGFFVFLFDVAKSFLPIYIAKYYQVNPITLSYCVAASIIGHCFSPFLSFHGGKGVATFLGGLFALNPVFGLYASSIWMSVYLATSLAALSSLCMVMFMAGCLFNTSSTTGLLIALFFIFIRHQSNWLRWRETLKS